MITREQAEAIAGSVLGKRPGAGPGWELVEFDIGWLIFEMSIASQARRPSPSRVVERRSGRVIRFPARIPPHRIVTEYNGLVSRGRIEYQGLRSHDRLGTLPAIFPR